MYKSALSVKSILLIAVLLTAFSNITSVSADTGLCPSGFDEGLVSTGFVDCYDESSFVSQFADAQIDRIGLEATCLTAPNAAVTRADIVTSSSGSSFRAEVTCTITRPLPAGTVLCPDDSDEAIRAFDTLVCEYFGDASATMQAAQAMLALETADCTTNSGSTLDSGVNQVTVSDTTFYFPTLACALPITSIDVIICPYGFYQSSPSNSTMLTCREDGELYESLAEALDGSLIAQNICTGTTAGLGTVTNIDAFETGPSMFVSRVTCTVKIPSYGEFADSAVVRACDSTCTEEVEQTRPCLNGGQVGGPGCVESATQLIERQCNTGTNADSLCPLVVTPNIHVPLILLGDEED